MEAPITLTNSITKRPSHHEEFEYTNKVDFRKKHQKLPPTNLVLRKTQFQQEKQDFRYLPQSPERDSIPNMNHEINQNQILESLTGEFSKILEESRKDPRIHQREMRSTVHSAME